MLTIEQIMLPVEILLSEQMSLAEAVERIAKAGGLGLPVVDKQAQLVGFVSEQDCLSALLTESYHCDSHTTVAQIMRSDVLTVNASDTVLSLAQQMGQQKPKRYPVVKAGKLAGIVSRSQVVKALSESLSQCKAF